MYANAFLQSSGDCPVPVADSDPAPPSQLYLSSVSPVDDNESVYTGTVEVDGGTYTKSVYWHQDTNDAPGWAEYNLSRDFSSFCVVAGVADTSDAVVEYELEVYVDGVSVDVVQVAVGVPATINVSVLNGLRLKLEARNQYRHVWVRSSGVGQRVSRDRSVQLRHVHGG